jgi:hypothetical protein
VFYIPGYDPLHPRRYRELYRTEGAAQAAISDYQLTLSPKQGGGNYGWQVDSVIDGGAVHVDAEVLVWSDIVRDSMVNSIAARPTGNLFAQHEFTSLQMHCGS